MRYLPILLLLITFLASAETIYQGKVIKIADGDTLTLLVDSKQLKIRLSDIDTPERKQPFGTKAKQALSELAFGKQARVVEVAVDRYKRIVGRVYVDGIDVNRELVARGFAWVYPKYSNDAELLDLEAQAMKKVLGCGLALIRYRLGSGDGGGEHREIPFAITVHSHDSFIHCKLYPVNGCAE